MGGRITDLVVLHGNVNAQGYVDKVLSNGFFVYKYGNPYDAK